MNEIEKRELFEQQQKVFEAGTQRADKRTGSFSFLTWPFFIAPLIASEEFLAATFKSAAAENEDAKAVQAGAMPQAADYSPTSDPSKASAEAETAKGPAASSESHAAQIDQIGIPAQSDEDAPRPSFARNEAVADTSSGGGGDGGGDDADSRHHGAHTSIDDSSVNSLSADSHFGSSPFPGGSTLESVQSIVLGGSFSPAIIGSAPPLGTVGGLSNDVVGGIAPVEAAAPPMLTTVTDTMGTLTHDVAGTLAPVETTVPPVLTMVTDTMATLTHDMVGAIAPVEAAVPPVLTTVGDNVGTLTHDVAGTLAPVESVVQPVLMTMNDTVGTLTHDVAGTLAPAEAAMQPVLATVGDNVGTLTYDMAGTLAPVESVVQPVLATATTTVGTPTHDVSHTADAGNVAAEALTSAAPLVDTTEPVLASAGVSHSNPTTDLLHPAVADTSAVPAAGPADTLLALATATDATIEVPGSATAAPANAVTNGSNAAAAVHPSAIPGDVIALNDASPPPAPDLFAGSQYTHYGVTLSSDIGVPLQQAVSPADSASAHDTLVPVVADAQKHAPPPPDIVDTTHPIDHLGHGIL